MAKRKVYVPRVELYFHYCVECVRDGMGEERYSSMMLTYHPDTHLCDECQKPLMRTIVGIETLKLDAFLDFLQLMGCLPTLPTRGGAA